MNFNKDFFKEERLHIYANHIFIQVDSTAKKIVLTKLQEMEYTWQSGVKPTDWIPITDIKYLAISCNNKQISIISPSFLEENIDILGKNIICSGEFLENPYNFLQENNNPVISR